MTNITSSNPSESSNNNHSTKRKKRRSKTKVQNIEDFPFNGVGDPEVDNLIKRKYIELASSGLSSNKKRSKLKKKNVEQSQVNFINYLLIF